MILCGGAINSPQLLMLSGVGPARHLNDHGIEVIADDLPFTATLDDVDSVIATLDRTVDALVGEGAA